MKTHPLTVRLKKEIHDLIVSGNNNTGLFTTVPDFIMYSMRNEYIKLIESIRDDDLEDFIQNLARNNMTFNLYKGDIYQTIIRIPTKMYNDLMIVLNSMMLGISDFIRSSIIDELGYEIYGYNFETVVFDYHHKVQNGTIVTTKTTFWKKKTGRKKDDDS